MNLQKRHENSKSKRKTNGLEKTETEPLLEFQLEEMTMDSIPL